MHHGPGHPDGDAACLRGAVRIAGLHQVSNALHLITKARKCDDTRAVDGSSALAQAAAVLRDSVAGECMSARCPAPSTNRTFDALGDPFRDRSH